MALQIRKTSALAIELLVKSINKFVGIEAIDHKAPSSLPNDHALLREDIATYRQIENWGVTLLVTAIALISKELHDMMQPGLSELIPSHFFGPPHEQPSDLFVSSPLLVGVIGSFFLFLINWRSRERRACFYGWKTPKPRGLLGWFFGTTPFGVSLLSSFFYVGVTLNFWSWAWIILGGAILVFQIVKEICLWRWWNNREKQTQSEASEKTEANSAG